MDEHTRYGRDAFARYDDTCACKSLDAEHDARTAMIERHCEEAAGRGDLARLREICSDGNPRIAGTRVCSAAAENGHLDCLTFAHENGYPWGHMTISGAARGGHLGCLTYAHDNGCPWGEWTCVEAASHGHSDCLAYAHENGCPWDSWTCDNAADNGRLACLAYAFERGCPFSESRISDRAREHLELRQRSATEVSRACRGWVARRRADVALVLAGRWGRAWGVPPPDPLPETETRTKRVRSRT